MLQVLYETNLTKKGYCMASGSTFIFRSEQTKGFMSIAQTVWAGKIISTIKTEVGLAI